jgi:polyisoprenoid-binding protein YceI
MKRTGVRFGWLKFEQTDRQEQTMNFFNRSKSSTATIEPTFDAPTSAVEDITGDYTIDQTHTRLGFSARHAMVTTVRGQFTDFAGTAHIDTANPAASTVSLTIKTASIDTGVADRDGHLRSADFFDAEANPEITFVSTEVEREDESTWLITGDLTMKGVSKPITLEFESTGSARDPFGNLRVGFEGAVTINRKDYGITWNAALETGGVLVSDKVTLEFELSLVKSA